MNQTAKNLVRVVGVVVGVAAAAWALRDQLLPTPESHPEEPPAFRQPGDDDGAPPDDLTTIKGIGPVTAGKLEEAGITSFSDLASADAEVLGEAIGSSASTVARWITAAASLT